jgi:hypothetical protein
MLKIAYRSFGRTPPAGLPPSTYAILWILSMVFVVVGLVATIVLNFFSLFAGVMILFVNRPAAEFHFLRLFGRVPAILVGIGVLAAYTIWHQSTLHGFWMVVGPMIAVWIVGAAMIGVCALWGAATRV